MIDTSANYKSLLAGTHITEVALMVGNGGTDPDTPGNSTVFREDSIFSMSSSHAMFDSQSKPVGNASAGEIDIEMMNPARTFGKRARLRPFVRLSNGLAGTLENHSEWIPKGVFFIDTREKSVRQNGDEVLTIHGYDAMLKAEADYPSTNKNSFPRTDTQVVNEIAAKIGVSVDERTVEIMTKNYRIPEWPKYYSMREVLQSIASMYAGNFIMTDFGELRLVTIAELPVDTNYLITENGSAITFGGDRILV